MQIVAHRVNTVDTLKKTPSEFGIEFDVRESPTGPIVTHDPWTPGVLLRDFLLFCDHAFYIVNIKAEGIEQEVLELLSQFGIENFFLLDCSFPMIVQLARRGERRVAVRVSEYESVETALSLAGQVEWIWIDVFSKIPVSPSMCVRLRNAGFKLCFVSPELQRRPDDLPAYRKAMEEHIDMVCTKFPMAWSSV